MSRPMNKQLAVVILLAAVLAVTAYVGWGAAIGGQPQATADTQQLTDKPGGYSLNYPAGYTVVQTTDTVTAIVVDSLMNHVDERVRIEVTDAAGRTPVEVADEIVADVETALPGFKVERSQITVGGEAAVVLNKLPGQDLSRVVVVVHHGRLYHLTFTPADEANGDAYQRMEKLYATIINSFRFA